MRGCEIKNSMEEQSAGIVQCIATECYFNSIYRGVLGCDLKCVLIEKGGRCSTFLPREEGNRIFGREGKG